MDAREMTAAFLRGDMPIEEFHKHYMEEPEIDAFLQGIVDEIKAAKGEFVPFPFPHPAKPGEIFRSDNGLHYLLAPETYPGEGYSVPNPYLSVRTLLTYKFRQVNHDVRTAGGARRFFDEVLVLFYQVQPSIVPTWKYSDAFNFALEVIPEYLSGGEAEEYIQRYIIPQFPETMKKAERKKAIKAKIKEEFRSEKGYPCWVQESEWPMSSNGKPAVYIGKGKREGDLFRWRFRDQATGGEIIVEQLA